MTDTHHLTLPFLDSAQAQKHVTHNEALRLLDAIVMLAVADRDLSSPPPTPAEGARYLVKPPGADAFASKDNQVAHFIDGAWMFLAPRAGWLCYVADEGLLLVHDGGAWSVATGSALQNLALLGVGTTADAANPLSAKLNNTLWVAKSVAEGGDGSLRFKMSKEDAGKTLSLLLQNNFSARAELGLTGDDDFHIKTSPDGGTFHDAMLFDAATGAAKFASALFMTARVSPPSLTADQNDYNPADLAKAGVLRLSGDALRNITGLSGGGDGRVIALVNVGASDIVLKTESASSSAANRFALGVDITLAAGRAATLWYDAVDSRWRRLAG